MTDYEQRRGDIISVRLLGAPARSAAAWLSAVDRAEREGRPCPTWDELERLAPSLPMVRAAVLAILEPTDAPPRHKTMTRDAWDALEERRDEG